MESRLNHINKELSALMEIAINNKVNFFLNDELFHELKKANEDLWDVCNLRRNFEAELNFGQKYIDLSRREYGLNDLRAIIKSKINNHFDSELVEVKSYSSMKFMGE